MDVQSLPPPPNNQQPHLPQLLVAEVQHFPRSFRRFLWPAACGFGGTIGVLLISFGIYAFWAHIKDGYSYSQIISSDIPIVPSTGHPLGDKPPADSSKSEAAKTNSDSRGMVASAQGNNSETIPSLRPNGTASQNGPSSNTGASGGSTNDLGNGGDNTTLPQLGCLSHPSVCGYPDATNTGVPAGTLLTAHPGSQKVTTDGAVINGWDTGRINIYANNVVIKNTRITTSAYYGVYVYSGSVTVEDTTIIGQATASQECDAGVTGAVLVLRVNISGCEDGVHLSGNHAVRDSYIHDPYFTSTSHNDGIQVFSASGGMVVQHNTIVMTDSNGSRQANSCVFVQPTSGSVDNVKIDSNLVDGGGYTLYIEQSTNVTLSYNRVGRDYGYGWFSRAHNTNMPVLVGNIWDDTGALVSS